MEGMEILSGVEKKQGPIVLGNDLIRCLAVHCITAEHFQKFPEKQGRNRPCFFLGLRVTINGSTAWVCMDNFKDI